MYFGKTENLSIQYSATTSRSLKLKPFYQAFHSLNLSHKSSSYEKRLNSKAFTPNKRKACMQIKKERLYRRRFNKSLSQQSQAMRRGFNTNKMFSTIISRTETGAIRLWENRFSRWKYLTVFSLPCADKKLEIENVASTFLAFPIMTHFLWRNVEELKIGETNENSCQEI